MTYTITPLEHITLLRINGQFVGSYDSIEAAEAVVDAYRGISVR